VYLGFKLQIYFLYHKEWLIDKEVFWQQSAVQQSLMKRVCGTGVTACANSIAQGGMRFAFPPYGVKDSEWLSMPPEELFKAVNSEK
jgi:hypothetical protein